MTRFDGVALENGAQMSAPSGVSRYAPARSARNDTSVRA